jgi:thiazole synthase
MFTLGSRTLHSRLLMGSALYPSIAVLSEAIKISGTQVITVSLKHEHLNNHQGQAFWECIKALNCWVLPNTAGCTNAIDAIEIAEMAREIFQTDWIKLEVVCPNGWLQPDPVELVKAATELIKRGFMVFPFCTEELALCEALYEGGCRILMPWGAPIGSGKGLLNPSQLKALRERFNDATLIIDAGIGHPGHALQAMQLGYDAVLINSAIAKAIDPVIMAKAFSLAVESGRLSIKAGPIPESDTAIASTNLTQTLFGGCLIHD